MDPIPAHSRGTAVTARSTTDGFGRSGGAAVYEEQEQEEAIVTPLTVPEARSILRADEALDATFEVREASGNLLSLEESDAWIKLVASARERVELYDGLTRRISGGGPQ